MKINKLLLIAAALVLSFAVLTACGGETTTDATPTPEATPTEEERTADWALSVYEKMEKVEFVSYCRGISYSFGGIIGGQNYDIFRTSDAICINKNREDFREYISTSYRVENLTTGEKTIVLEEHGYIDGYEFLELTKEDEIISQYRQAVTVEQYAFEVFTPELMEVLRPTKDKCAIIGGYVIDGGRVSIHFQDYTPEYERLIYNTVLGDKVDMFGEPVSIDIRYWLEVGRDEIRTPHEKTLIVCVEYDDSEGMAFEYSESYYNVDGKIEIPGMEFPEIDLSQYEDITPPDQYEALLEGYETATVHNVKFLSRRDNAWFNENMIMVTSSQDLIQLLGDKVSADKLVTYNDEYFNDKVVLLVQFMHFSGSDQIHKFVGVIVNNNKMYPVVVNGFRGLGTADIKHTIMLVELDKECVEMDLGRILEIDRYSDEAFNPNFGER